MQRWKDAFHFTKKERRGILGLLVLILFAFIASHIIKQSPTDWSENDRKRSEIYKKLELATRVEDSIFRAKKSKSLINIKKDSLFSFNPNEIGKEEWEALGLSEKQAASIINYLTKGGKFRIKTDLKKMYVIDDSFYEKLKDYILLPKEFPKSTYAKSKKAKNYSATSKKWEKPIVEINSADTTAFKKLYGIGSKLSSRIVKYRESLGGFHSVSQLAEVWGVHDTLLTNLSSQLKIEEISLSKISINQGAEKLKNHPYISWKVAKVIEKYRDKHGDFQKLEDLKKIHLISNELYLKISPYLKVEQ